jgi:hypothetical protein
MNDFAVGSVSNLAASDLAEEQEATCRARFVLNSTSLQPIPVPPAKVRVFKP